MNHTIVATENPFGQLLRTWQINRRVSQMWLALEADLSARHLSCVETGRAQPSREAVLRLAEMCIRDSAYVTLDEGPTLLTNIVDSPVAAIAIGARVELVFRDVNGVPTPMFKLTTSCGPAMAPA